MRIAPAEQIEHWQRTLRLARVHAEYLRHPNSHELIRDGLVIRYLAWSGGDAAPPAPQPTCAARQPAPQPAADQRRAVDVEARPGTPAAGPARASQDGAGAARLAAQRGDLSGPCAPRRGEQGADTTSGPPTDRLVSRRQDAGDSRVRAHRAGRQSTNEG